MPTYEYACQSCEYEFEQFQSMLDAPLTKCPECGKKRLKRLVGLGAGLIFKGTGFYITDYKKKTGGEPKAGGDATAGGETKASPTAKTGGETKPAPATATSPAKTPSAPSKS